MSNLRSIGLATLLAASLSAADYAAPEGYLSDFARVVDAGSRAELERYCAKFERATGVQLAFVTVPSLGDEPIDDFANKLARKWGVGQKGKNEGLLVVLAIQERKLRAEIGYGLEGYIPDGAAGAALRANRELLKAGQYGQAAVNIARTFGSQIARGRNVSFDEEDPVASAPNPFAEGIPAIFLIVCVLFILAIFFIGRRASRGSSSYRGRRGGGPFIFGGGPGLGGGGDWGGGGFGGSGSSDSGSGFGGFGGGDFGGGGASSDW